ncbi:hypothetical protein RSAG8_02160, partial [Rhizoctonia solani AG-8 WAC10335]
MASSPTIHETTAGHSVCLSGTSTVGSTKDVGSLPAVHNTPTQAAISRSQRLSKPPIVPIDPPFPTTATTMASTPATESQPQPQPQASGRPTGQPRIDPSPNC